MRKSKKPRQEPAEPFDTKPIFQYAWEVGKREYDACPCDYWIDLSLQILVAYQNPKPLPTDLLPEK